MNPNHLAPVTALMATVVAVLVAANFSSLAGSSPSRHATNGVAPQSSGIEQLYRSPIRFLGRVVDQDEQPVPNASVSFEWTDLSPTGWSSLRTLSDQAGYFTLAEVRGRALRVTVSKAGYYTIGSQRQTRFAYSDQIDPDYFRYDPLTPVVFRLQKMGEGASLVTSQYGVSSALTVSAPTDGTPVFVDFFNRSVGSVGQMQISQIKPTRGEPSTEWYLRLTIPDGELIEHADDLPFQAPESGYNPVTEFHLRQGETNWTPILKKEVLHRLWPTSALWPDLH